MIFNCLRCNYSTERKSNIRDHYSRKRACKVIKKNIPLNECLKFLENPKVKFDELLYLREQLKIAHDQLKEKDKLIETLSKTQGNNNNNIIIHNHINVVPFKDTNYNLLQDDIIKCLENCKGNVPMFEKLIEKIHFDKDNPQNHNIYKPNCRVDRILTFNGASFIIDKMAVDTMLKKLENMMENNIDKVQGKKYIDKLKCHLKMKQTDQEYLQQTIEDISDSLYNGRDIVKKTIKSNKN